MIELIFVIVILGILAAVAIPKLAATRDDAKISKGATELATAISDIGAYYTSHGSFAKVSDMTNVSFDDNTKGAADNDVVNYEVDSKKCAKLTFTGSTGTLTVADGADVGDARCTGIKTASAKLWKTHNFGGSRVAY